MLLKLTDQIQLINFIINCFVESNTWIMIPNNINTLPGANMKVENHLSLVDVMEDPWGQAIHVTPMGPFPVGPAVVTYLVLDSEGEDQRHQV